MERRGKRWILSKCIIRNLQTINKIRNVRNIKNIGTERDYYTDDPWKLYTVLQSNAQIQWTVSFIQSIQKRWIYGVKREVGDHQGLRQRKREILVNGDWQLMTNFLSEWQLPVLESTDDWENIKILTLILILSSKIIFLKVNCILTFKFQII